MKIKPFSALSKATLLALTIATLTCAGGLPAYQYGIDMINDCGLMDGVAFDQAVDFDPTVPSYGVLYHGLLLNASLSLFEVFDPPGSRCTVPFAINAAALILGNYTDQADVMHDFLTHRGRGFLNIDVPGAVGTSAMCINHKGEIIGNFADPAAVWRGFLLHCGRFAKS